MVRSATFTSHTGTKVRQGDGNLRLVIFSRGSTPFFAASEERTDRPMRPHSSVPSEDHVTQVRPQSLSIDCQVQDVVFTCAFNLYKYYTIRRQIYT